MKSSCYDSWKVYSQHEKFIIPDPPPLFFSPPPLIFEASSSPKRDTNKKKTLEGLGKNKQNGK